MSWYLKKADGSVFGPVEDDAVLQWAREGRIVPGDLLSPDEKQWSAPGELDDLGMDWFIPLADGTPYGPLHALALGDFLREGSLGLDDTVAHKTTREVRRVCEVLLPALQHYAASLRATLGEEQARAETLSRETGQRAGHDDARLLERLKSELKTSRQTGEAQGNEILRLKQSLEDEQAAQRRRAAEQQHRIKELEESELHLIKLLESAREKEALLERQRTEPGAGSTDYASLVHSYDDLSRNYDLLMEQFTAKSADLSAAYAANDTLKQESEARAVRLEETLKTERAAADKARQRLAKTEEAHLELVRSYRELNDRYIRYRQKMEGPAIQGEVQAAADPKPKVRLV